MLAEIDDGRGRPPSTTSGWRVARQARQARAAREQKVELSPTQTAVTGRRTSASRRPWAVCHGPNVYPRGFACFARFQVFAYLGVAVNVCDDHTVRPGTAAVVLLSGGLDSSTVLAIAAREAKQQVYAISFAYGQRHEHELSCAALQAQCFGVVTHQIVDLSPLGRLVAPATSLIAGSELEVPSAHARAGHDDVPNTYVPARNTVFLSYALAWAEVVGARDIWLGVNAVDYSGYPDCRPEFIEAFERMANLGTKRAGGADQLRIQAPLIHLHKHQIIARGVALGVDYSQTTSCYDPEPDPSKAAALGSSLACGRCESCALRRAGFEQAGVADPTRYVRA